ncbi:hypothetical protein ACXZ9C_11785 [Streptococcus agalactiae]
MASRGAGVVVASRRGAWRVGGRRRRRVVASSSSALVVRWWRASSRVGLALRVACVGVASAWRGVVASRSVASRGVRRASAWRGVALAWR